MTAYTDLLAPASHRAVSPALPLGAISYDAATVRAFVRARDTRQQRVQSSDILASEAFHIARGKMIVLLTDAGREGDSERWQQVITVLGEICEHREGAAVLGALLTHIATDDGALLGLRASAARLLAALLPTSRAVDGIGRSPIALVRIGLLLGWSDADHANRIRRFLADPDPDVAAEARFLLDDAGLEP